MEVGCIGKGKEHKKYEFGSKVAFAVGHKSNVSKAAVSFKGNPNDHQRVGKTFEQQKKLTGASPKKADVERGIKSQQGGETEVIARSNGKGKEAAEKAELRKGFRRRAGIQPILGHLKSDCGMERNYLKGEIGDQIKAILGASAFNFRSWLRKAMENIIFVINYLQIVRQWWLQKPLEAN